MAYFSLLMLGASSTVISSAAPAKPNIVWIMADDLGWGEVGIYPCTSKVGRIATPNLDKFGSEGIQFTNAYAGYTVCAPSRTTLFTGRHSGQFPKLNLSGTSLKPGEALTTSEVLQKAGYKTGAFGKAAPLTSPTEQGFDQYLGQINQGYCHDMYPDVIDVAPPIGNVLHLPLNAGPKNRTSCMAKPQNYNYTVDMFQDAALDWLDGALKQSDPFFMYLSFTVPHAGGWGNPPDQPEQGAPVPSDGQYAGKQWPDVEKDHAAVITYVDNKIGEVMSKISLAGADEKTVVFFASDNGAHNEGGHSHAFFNSTGGLAGFKRSLYEGGVRSPTMIRWPGTVTPRVSAFEFAFWDFMPTVAALSGGTGNPDTDGISIADFLTSGAEPVRDYIYHTWSGGKATDLIIGNSPGKTTGYGIRIGNFKGVVQHCHNMPSMSDSFEIYDLTADPFEQNNIAHQRPTTITAMKQLIASKKLSCQCFQC